MALSPGSVFSNNLLHTPLTACSKASQGVRGNEGRGKQLHATEKLRGVPLLVLNCVLPAPNPNGILLPFIQA